MVAKKADGIIDIALERFLFGDLRQIAQQGQTIGEQFPAHGAQDIAAILSGAQIRASRKELTRTRSMT